MSEGGKYHRETGGRLGSAAMPSHMVKERGHVSEDMEEARGVEWARRSPPGGGDQEGRGSDGKSQGRVRARCGWSSVKEGTTAGGEVPGEGLGWWQKRASGPWLTFALSELESLQVWSRGAARSEEGSLGRKATPCKGRERRTGLCACMPYWWWMLPLLPFHFV